MAWADRVPPEGPPRSAPSGRGWPTVVLGGGQVPGLGGAAERLARPARRRAAGVRRSDSMRSVLARTPGNGTCATACATPRSPLRQGSHRLVDSGAPAPDFPIGSACCLRQRALSVSGVALTGL